MQKWKKKNKIKFVMLKSSKVVFVFVLLVYVTIWEHEVQRQSSRNSQLFYGFSLICRGIKREGSLP